MDMALICLLSDVEFLNDFLISFISLLPRSLLPDVLALGLNINMPLPWKQKALNVFLSLAPTITLHNYTIKDKVKCCHSIVFAF